MEGVVLANVDKRKFLLLSLAVSISRVVRITVLDRASRPGTRETDLRGDCINVLVHFLCSYLQAQVIVGKTRMPPTDRIPLIPVTLLQLSHKK